MKTLINLTKLRGKMAENNLTSRELAEMLNLSRTSISLKLNGIRQFCDSEIYILATKFGSYIFNPIE